MKRQYSLVETPKKIFGKRTDYAERVLADMLGKDYVEYRKKWVKASRREIVTAFPLCIQIEHVGRCNLRCPVCIHGAEQLRKNYIRDIKAPLDIQLYKRVLDEVRKYRCPSMAFHNNDEPLLLNDLDYRIRLAKKAGVMDIILNTNAILLTREKTHKLLKSGITKISFSVDAYNEKDYLSRRVGGDFEQVLKNIDYFMEQRKASNLRLPTTRATCLLTRFGVEGMNKFLKFWKDKVDMVEFQNFQPIQGYNEHLISPRATLDTHFTCNGPWQLLAIRPNADVLPCCSFYGTEIVVGNIKESSVYDIWNSGRMKRIREELLKDNFGFSPACRKCCDTFFRIE